MDIFAFRHDRIFASHVTAAIAGIAAVMCSAALASSYEVSGTMRETFIQFAGDGQKILAVSASNTFMGDLEGEGTLHIFGGDIVDPLVPTVENVKSTRRIRTKDGNLTLDEIGRRHGDDVEVHSTVSGGTGRYKGATGEITFIGVHDSTGVDFTYSGVITTPN